jgi:iron complex transport system substrate-binding protein
MQIFLPHEFTARILLALVLIIVSSSFLWAGNTVNASANRIVSTSPSITEILFNLGLKNRVVAVTDFCKYPLDACKLPSIGGMLNPNMEAVVSLNPDLIIHQSENSKFANNAKNLGINTLEVSMDNLGDIFESVKTLGINLKCQDSANKLLLHLKEGITYYQERRLPKKKVLLLLGDGNDPSRDLYAVGPGTFLNELLELSGGQNIISNSQARYPKLSKEYIINISPEIIIEAGPKSNLSKEDIEFRIKAWGRFPTIEAVKKKQIYFIGADYILIPGPRLLKTIERFSQAIHPELLADPFEKTRLQGILNP